jgi:MoaA/NifB/PqqE/SkfB family radical SAM enzyme
LELSKITPYLEDINNNSKLLSLQLNITNKCYSRCKSCRKYEWPEVKLAADEIDVICKDAKANGCETFVISGGEPFAHPEIERILQVVANYGSVGLITSAIGTDAGKLKLAARVCEWIQVSLDSVDDEQFKEIRGINACETVKNNIKILQQNREKHQRPVKINAVVSKLNFSSVKNVADFAISNGCEVGIYPVHTWQDLELSEASKKMLEHYGVISKKVNLAPICIVPRIHAVVDATGYVYPCCRLLNDNGDYDESMSNAIGHYVLGFEVLLGKAKKFQTAPLTNELCKECDRYRAINTEYYNYVSSRKPIFL